MTFSHVGRLYIMAEAAAAIDLPHAFSVCIYLRPCLLCLSPSPSPSPSLLLLSLQAPARERASERNNYLKARVSGVVQRRSM